MEKFSGDAYWNGLRKLFITDPDSYFIADSLHREAVRRGKSELLEGNLQQAYDYFDTAKLIGSFMPVDDPRNPFTSNHTTRQQG